MFTQILNIGIFYKFQCIIKNANYRFFQSVNFNPSFTVRVKLVKPFVLYFIIVINTHYKTSLRKDGNMAKPNKF